MDNFIILSFVGEGSFGRVFKAKRKETDAIVALKVIRKKGRSAKDLKNLRQECDIQRLLDHPNIIRMIDSFDTDSEMVVVTEFAEKELHSILGKEGCLDERQAQAITWDLVSALYYLHSNRVLHRDLKPQNVLIDNTGHAKLCDFGLARNMTTGTHVLTSIKGTPLYMAPELIDEKPYDHQADLWSLGCIVYELVAGQPPFCTTSIVQLVRMIRHKPVQWPSFISPEAFSFLQGLLHKDPAQRMGWPEILTHPFVSGHILILPEDQQSESPFTKPLSHSQMEAKLLQREKLNNPIKVVHNAVQILEKREHDPSSGRGLMQAMECVPISDDDSVRAMSAFSVRDSLKTDDEDLHQAMTAGNARLLRHEYSAINQNNLVVCNLENNMAQLIAEPKELKKSSHASENVPKKVNADLQTIPESISDNNSKAESTTYDEITLDNQVNNIEVNSFVGSDACNRDEKSTASKSMSNDKKTNTAGIKLSKSVPPSYKQKFLQFSIDKLKFSKSNLLTRSLKKSLHINRSGEKGKQEVHRRLSEPVCFEKQSSSITEGDVSLDKEDLDNAITKYEDPVEDPIIDKYLTESNIDKSSEEDEPSEIEQEEWQAFLKSNMSEVMEGDLDSLTQLNMVSMVTGVVRRSGGGGSRVLASAAMLLSLPFVAPDVSLEVLDVIQDIYLEARIVPNLVYAMKMLMKVSKESDIANDFSKIALDLPTEKLEALEGVLELVSQLCLRSPPFAQQLCDAVAVLNAAPLFAGLFALYSKSLRIVLNVITIMIAVLQDLPENSELVESVMFEGSGVDICQLLNQTNVPLKIRTCVFVGLLSTFCCRTFCSSMNKVWNKEQRESIEGLQDDLNPSLARAAKGAVRELAHMPFYRLNHSKVG